jgi:general secretion pathway protein E/type IV pilus assembly protein PilB
LTVAQNNSKTDVLRNNGLHGFRLPTPESALHLSTRNLPVRAADESVVRLALERGLVTPAQLRAARVRTDRTGATADAPLDQIEWLIQECSIDGWRLARLLAEAHGLPAVELQAVAVAPAALAAVPCDLAERGCAFPFARSEGTVRVAIGNPFDVEAIEHLRRSVLAAIDLAVAPVEEIRRAIRIHYGRDSTFELSEEAADEPPPAVAETVGDQAPVISLVESIVERAVARRASDIHLEPLARRCRVRYRIDGVMQSAGDLPDGLQRSVVSRLKIIANMDIAEKRLPQDGRARVNLQGRTVDLRISSLPSVHGESMVLRLLEPEKIRPGVAELGLDGANQKALARLLALPDGIVLVTGPTGSGKTTTLYACLNHLNTPDRKIITVEDPVEYQLAGINQVAVQGDVGMTFAAALRAILRQAPNIVMVGEIRDRETADMAINAALTGHVVFSTLHTNDAPGAVTRLFDLGVKPFLVASALRAVVAQRLVRRLCPLCFGTQNAGRAGSTSGEFRKDRHAGSPECPACCGSGYSGRVGLFELLAVNPALQQLIYERAGAGRLRREARLQGMCSLRDDGLRKAEAGLTTVEEVLGATLADANEI